MYQLRPEEVALQDRPIQDLDDAELYGHFCNECSRLEPNGWFVRASVTGRRKKRRPPAS